MQVHEHFRTRSLERALKVSLLASTWLCPGFTTAYAGPEVGNVAYGSATINQSGLNTTINQASQRAVIDWQSFNVGHDESVQFVQPNATAIAVNRIHDVNPSVILGTLSANGQVMLINQNGVVFGNSAQVDVGSLVVSTAMPTEQTAADFAHGVRNDLSMTLAGRPDALIYNGGAVTARDAGLVGFVAPNIVNDGIIVANKGVVQLASGSTATLDLYGDGLIDIAVDPHTQHQLIEQHGWIQADGGKVAITAAAGEEIVNSVINMSGVTQARSIEQKDGVIILKGDDSTLTVSGKIDASGKTAGQKGGAITVTAKNIRFKSGAELNASGDKGGGTIKVGGDYKGQGNLPTAQTLTVEQGAAIYNDALTQGNGGTTILWSDDHTTFAGNISARGGTVSGAGGFVETSGKDKLSVSGKVDLRSQTGMTGLWLLDPTNITIYNRAQTGTDNVNSFSTGYLETASSSADISLSATNDISLNLTSDILSLVGNRSITLTAGNNITSASNGAFVTSGTGGLTLTAGNNINFVHDFDLTANGSGNVTLQAGNNINYSASGDITTNGGTITLNSDRDANGAGSITASAGTDLVSSGGNVTLGGGTNPLVGYAMGQSGTAYGINFTGATINAGGGNIVLNGQGFADAACSNNCFGIRAGGSGTSFVTTGNGSITFNGIGGGTGGTVYNSAINFTNTANITTQNGNITISGKVMETGGGANAVGFNGVTATTTGSGNIAIIDTTGSLTRDVAAFYTTASAMTAGGNLIFTGNKFATPPSIYPTLTAGSDIIIRPYTAGTTVSVGSGTSNLNITDAWLNKMTWGGTLWLGGYGLTGLEAGYWNASGDMTINTTRSFAGNVNFISGGNILSGGAGTVTLSGAANATLWALSDVNITHDLDFTASGMGSVTERANGNITYSGSGDILTNGGAIVLNSDRDANNSGAISLGSGTALTSNGGTITLGGGIDPTTTAATGSTAYVHGISLSGAVLDASSGVTGGNIFLTGQGSFSSSPTNMYGVFLSASTVQTNNNGSITVTGVGGNTHATQTFNDGIRLINTSEIITANGAISLSGTGGGSNTSSNNMGILLGSSGVNKIRSTGTGNITAVGRGSLAAGSTGNVGILIYNATGGFLSTNGDISLTGIITTGGGSFGFWNNSSTASGVIGGPSATGKISIISDSLSSTLWTPSIQTTGDVVIRPYTAGTTVGIGTGSGTLAISDQLLNNITAANLWLGGYGLTGAESGYWNASGDLTINTTRGFANTVNFISGSNIVSGGASTITLSGAANTTLWALSDINITHDLDFTASGTGSVTERANGNITYTGSGDITTNAGAITLNSDRDATNGGAITLRWGTTLTTTTGNMVLGGGANPATTNAIGTYSNTGSSSSGVAVQGATLTSGSGNITLNGTGWAASGGNNNSWGVFVEGGGTVTTGGSGNIAINAIGGGTASNTSNSALRMENTGQINAVNGNISLTGQVISSSGGSSVSMGSGARIQTSGTGNITVTSTNLTGTVGLEGFGSTNYITSGGSFAFIGDRLNQSSTLVTINAVNDVVIRPYTVGTTVGIGTGSGILAITDVWLNNVVTASTLWLGGYGLTGLESGYWNSAGALTINTSLTFGKNTNFLSNAAIVQSGTALTAGSAASLILNTPATITSTAISMGSGNLTLTADDLVLNGNLSGTGTLTLQPYTTNRIVRVNNGMADFNLSTTEMSRAVSGWGSVKIGRTDNTASTFINASASDSLTFDNPLVFLNGSQRKVYGNLSGTGNATLTFTGGWIDLYGNLSTAGRAMTFGGGLTGYGGSVTTLGGVVTANAIGSYVTTGNGLLIDTAGGALLTSGITSFGGNAAGSTVFLNAGSGTITFNGAANTAANITATAANITFNGAWGGTTPLGTVSLTSTGSLILPSITTTAGKTVNATVTGTGNSITASTITTGNAGNITLAADDLILNGNLSGTGTLTLQPNAASRSVYVNYGTADGTNFNLSNTEIAKLTDGWSQINIGRSDGSIDMLVGTSSWSDPLNLRNAYRISIKGAVTGTDNASMSATNAASWMNLEGSITTTGQNVSTFLLGAYGGTINTNGGNVSVTREINMSTPVGSGVTINTSGGNIALGTGLLDASTSSAGKLATLNAGTGLVSFGSTVNAATNVAITAASVTFNGAWGGTIPLGNLSITSTGNLILPSITTAAGKSVDISVTGAGNSITAGAIATGVGGNISLTADDLVLTGNLSGTGTLTLQPYAATTKLRVNDGAGDFNISTSELAYFTDGWNAVNIGRTNSGATTYIGPSVWNDPVYFKSPSLTYIDGAVSGTGNASFVFDGGSFIRNGSVATANQPISFTRQAVFESAGSLASNGGAITVGQYLGFYSYTLPNTTATTINSGGGAITLTGGIAVSGANSVATRSLTLDAGSGAVVFGSTVNSDIDMTVTAGSMTFNGAWGGTTPLGNLSITSTGNLILPSITTTAGKTVTATVTGAGNTITTNTIATGSGGSIALTADDLIINGNLSGTGMVTLQPYTTNRLIYINYGTADGTNLNLATTEIARVTDGWSQINVGRTDGLGSIEIGASTWSDPVAFRTNYRAQVNGALTGTGNTSFAFTNGGYTNIFNDITTAGQAVTFGGIAQADRGTITTNGGPVTFGVYLNIANNTLNPFNVISGNGNILIAGPLSQIGNTATKNVAFNAGTGTITFNGQVNGAYNLSATSGSTTFNGAWGSTTPLGNLSITSTGNLILPSITTVAGKSVDISVTGAGNTITAGAIATGTGGILSLTADDLVLTGNLSGTGTLTLQPYATNRLISVNNNTADGTHFNLSSTDIAKLSDGWAQINVGRIDSTANIEIGSSSWLDPVNFRNSYRINQNATLTGSDNASFVFGSNSSSWTNLNGTVATAGGNVLLNGGINNLNSNTSINTNGGNITFLNAVNNGTATIKSLTLNAGTGAINLNGVNSNVLNNSINLMLTGNTIFNTNTLGTASLSLGTVTINSVNSINLPVIYATSLTTNVSSAGNSITTDTITTGVGGNVSLTADDLFLNSNVSGTGTLTLQPYAAGRPLYINYGTADGTNFNLSTAEIAKLVDGWSTINIGRTDGVANVEIGASTWTDPVVFRNDYRMNMNGDITGTGNANFTFNSGLTNAWLNLGNKTLTTNGGDITFARKVYYLASGTTTVNSNGGAVNVTGGLKTYTGNLTINSGNGNISVISIAENGASLGSLTTLNAGTGTLAFGGLVNTAGNIAASAGSITFSGAWGGNTPLGTLSLTSTGNLILPAITTAAGKAVTVNVTGAGNTVTASSIATGASGSVSLTADDVVLNGNLSGTGTLILQPGSSNRPVKVNYGTADGTSLHLSTAEMAKLTEGWNGIMIGQAAGSGNVNIGASSWTDPVTFRGGAKNVWGALSGTDNASFVFQGTSLNLGNTSITTNNQKVEFTGAGYFYYYGSALIATNGGAITLPQLTTSADATTALTLSSSGGAIYLKSSIGNTVAGNIALNAGSGALTFDGLINGAYNIAATANTITFNGAWGNSTALGNVSLTSASSLNLPSIRANSVFAQTTGAVSDITLGSGITLMTTGTGNALTLVAGRHFINNSSNALVPNNGGSWRVYSTNVTGTVGEENLGDHFNRYSCSYTGGCATGVSVPANGNGMFYSYTPNLIATPLSQSVVYGNSATLNNYGYALSGYIEVGDAASDVVTGSLNGTTSYIAGNDVGQYNLDYGSGSLASILGYSISYTNRANAINVTPKALTVALTGTISKVYDQTTTGTLGTGNYILTDRFGADDVSISTTSGLYDTINVGSSKLVTVTGLTLGGSKAGNYTLATTTASGAIGEITPRALTISGITAGNKVYDGTIGATFNTTGATFSNLLSGDAVVLNGGNAVFVDKNVANGISVTLSGFGISGTDALNYTLLQPNAVTANITPKTLYAALTGTVTKVYDGTTTASFADANYALGNGIINGDAVSITGNHTGIYADKNVNTGISVTANGLYLTGAHAGNYTLSSNSVTDTIGSITPKGLSVTATIGQHKTYGSSDTAFGYTYNGLAVGDSSANFTGSLQRVSGENAGTYAINQGSLAATGNYTITSYVANNFAIDKAAITITGPVVSRYYGDGNPSLNWTNATINGLQFGETGAVLDNLSFNIVGSATSYAIAGTGHVITLGGFNDNNYTLGGFTVGSLTINKAPLLIRANDQTRLSILPPAPFSASFYGLKNSDTPSVITGLSFSTTGGVGALPGAYAIIASGGSAANYTISYNTGNLIVLPSALPTTIQVTHISNDATMRNTSVSQGQNKTTTSNASASDHSESSTLPNSDETLGDTLSINLQSVPWDNRTSVFSINNPLVSYSPELKNQLGI